MANVKKIFDVGVDIDAVKSFGFKTASELKAEPGKIFGHLASTDQDAAYAELAKELDLTDTVKPVAQGKVTSS